ncbi:MAG: hypothetical protein ACKVP4_10515 [Hyphomicrobium sp.]
MSQSTVPITGYAWSDTIGWISLHCSDLGTCATNNYGLSLAADGGISGYAWSEHVGWVSANADDLAGCPAAPCAAGLSDDALHGWLRAVAGDTEQSGGWNGFIRLSGPGYGVTRANATMSGFAWGSLVVGWVDFALSINENNQCSPTFSCDGNAVRNSCTGEAIPCPTGYVCSAGACIANAAPVATAEITVAPSLVRRGLTTTVAWRSAGMASCSVTEDNPSIENAWSRLSGEETSSGISQRTTYTLSCVTPAGTPVVDSAVVNLLPAFREI